jgi:hypothetical protein
LNFLFRIFYWKSFEYFNGNFVTVFPMDFMVLSGESLLEDADGLTVKDC